MKASNLDAAISISDLFQTLASAVSRVQETEYNIDGGESAAGRMGVFGQDSRVRCRRKTRCLWRDFPT